MGNVANRVFESAGPDGKVRGTPQQIIDKYQALARDAQLSGDRVIAENYLQHSEHYSRLLGEATRQLNEQRAAQQERENAQAQQRSERQGGDAHGGGEDREGREVQQTRDRQSGEGRQDRDDRRERDDRQNRENGRDGNRDNARDERRASEDQPRVESGLTTIDPAEGAAASGPVETPEGGRRDGRVTRPADDDGSTPSEVQPASDTEAAPQPVKRPRTRRKAKPEADGESAAARAE